MDYAKLGARPRPADKRDILLGAAQAPVAIPATYMPDMSWFKRLYQGETAFCGEHAGAHFQAILEHQTAPQVSQQFSPRYGAIKLKTPSSPVYDGFAIEDGTTLTAIFKWLQKVGAADYEPLENDVLLPVQTYCDPSAVTPAMDADAGNNKILSYGFDALTFDALKQAIYQNKAVIVLIKMDNGFFGTINPTFTTPTNGHFVCAYAYDETGIWVVDSADPENEFAFKHIATEYITPEFFFESGAALLPAALAPIVQEAAAIVPEIESAPATPAQKETLLEQVEGIVQDIEEII
jgi:hypothetical protein